MPRTALVLALCIAATPLAGCASRANVRAAESAQLIQVGDPFETTRGSVYVLRIQDEYRLIRCVPDGPIAGCWEDVLSVPDSELVWNDWVDVGGMPGVHVSFVSPTQVAVRETSAAAQ